MSLDLWDSDSCHPAPDTSSISPQEALTAHVRPTTARAFQTCVLSPWLNPAYPDPLFSLSILLAGV